MSLEIIKLRVHVHMYDHITIIWIPAKLDPTIYARPDRAATSIRFVLFRRIDPWRSRSLRLDFTLIVHDCIEVRLNVDNHKPFI